MADYSKRYLHDINYKKSASEQGVAVYGAGDGEKEIARLSITLQAGYKQFPKPRKSFEVNSAVKWNPSDFAIETGEKYSITVSSTSHEQKWADGSLQTDANGYSSYFDSLSIFY